MPSLNRKHEDLKRTVKAPVTKTKEVNIRVFLIEVYEIPHKNIIFCLD